MLRATFRRPAHPAAYQFPVERAGVDSSLPKFLELLFHGISVDGVLLIGESERTSHDATCNTTRQYCGEIAHNYDNWFWYQSDRNELARIQSFIADQLAVG